MPFENVSDPISLRRTIAVKSIYNVGLSLGTRGADKRRETYGADWVSR